MKIGASIEALQQVQFELSKTPGRIADAMHNPESKDGVEKVFTDMMTGENTFKANVEAIRTMTTVEDMLLNQLRDQ